MEPINVMSTIALYIRVSTLEQAKEGYSIAAQKERLIAYCKAQGWASYKLYVDEGVSAKDTKRPELQRMFDDMKHGKIQMILVYRLDRFTRRVKDLYTMLEEMQKYNCAFKSATELYDTSSAMGRMFIGLVALLAQWETENLSERIKMALDEKVSGGERVGNIPYGFNLTEDETLVKNEKSAVVLDMIEKIMSGMSANQVAVYLNKINNDRDWIANKVLRILRNPALYGATRWNDKIYESTHEGLITKQKFLKLQRMLTDRSLHHRRDVEVDYIFQGVLICPYCGRILSVNRYIKKSRTDGSEIKGAVYRCQVCIKEKRASFAIGEYRFENALKEYMKNVDIKHYQPIKNKNEKNIYVDQLKQIEKKREKYQRAWASDKMTDKEFDKMMDETRDVYEDLKEKVKQIPVEKSVNIDEIADVIKSFNYNFYFLSQKEKSKFISTFIRKIEFNIVPQPPKQPNKSKKGKALIEVFNVELY